MEMLSWIVDCASVVVVALSLLSGKAVAQGDLCTCSPSKYTFTFDYALICPPVNVSRNGGISATFCQLTPFGEPDEIIDDLVPVEVKYVQVLELGQRFQVLQQKNLTSTSGNFQDGDTIEYESISGNDGSGEFVPNVIQLNMFALNEAGQTILNMLAISFTNKCGEFTTLIEGESAGWVQFTKLEPPSAVVCPGITTMISPEEASTEPPAEASTDVPTASPTPELIVISTESVIEVLNSTASPEPPVEASTDVPTAAPTPELIVISTESVIEVLNSTASPEPPTPSSSSTTTTDVPTAAPTPELTASIDTSSTDMDLILDGAMSMSMSMSMPMAAAESREWSVRFSDTKSAKGSEVEKSLKGVKAEKKTKFEKVEKAADETNSTTKAEKSLKSAKDEKSEKADKTAKQEKTRRLRFRPLYKAL